MSISTVHLTNVALSRANSRYYVVQVVSQSEMLTKDDGVPGHLVLGVVWQQLSLLLQRNVGVKTARVSFYKHLLLAKL